jgi:hypothetical protein
MGWVFLHTLITSVCEYIRSSLPRHYTFSSKDFQSEARRLHCPMLQNDGSLSPNGPSVSNIFIVNDLQETIPHV